jgi:hypothetical protein
VSHARTAPSALYLACAHAGRMVRLLVARLGGANVREIETSGTTTGANGATMAEALAYRCFRVESAEPYGWVVYLEGTRRTHFFMARGLALSLAKLWAQAIPPSKVQLIDLSGRVSQEWTFRARLTSA